MSMPICTVRLRAFRVRAGLCTRSATSSAPEQAEDRSAGAHPRIGRGSVAGRRARRGTDQVDAQEPTWAVERLHDRSDDPQRVHVETQVDDGAMDQGHAEQAPVLAVDIHRALVQQEHALEAGIPAVQHQQADHAGDGQDAVGHHRLRHAVGARAAEGAFGPAVVPQLLAQPADARLDLRLFRSRRPTPRLAVGARRSADVIAAHARRRQRLPGAPGELILRCLGGADPGLQRSGFVVHSVAALGQAQQGRRVEHRVAAADDADERPRGKVPITLIGQHLPSLQQAHGDVAVEWAGPAAGSGNEEGAGSAPRPGERSVIAPDSTRPGRIRPSTHGGASRATALA